jgi:hypothetical protein
MSTVKVGDGLADRLAEHAEERRLRWVDRDDVEAFLLKRRGDFRTDETHAHDDDPAAGDDLLPNAVGVLDGAETVDAFKIGTGNRDAPVLPSCGNQQRVERHLTTILELHDTR